MQVTYHQSLLPRSWPHGRLGQIAGATFVVAALCISAKVFYYIFTEQIAGAGTGPERQASTQTASGNIFYLMLWASLYGWAMLQLGLQYLRHGLHPVLLRAVPLSALALASVFWSVSPQRTMLHATMFTLNILIGYVISQSMSPRMFLLVVRRTIIVLMLVSLVLMALIPEVAATIRHDGAWLSDREMRGVFPFKTDAGWLFGLLFLLIFWMRDWKGGLASKLIMGAVTVFAVLLSNSATGIACGITVMIVLFMIELVPDRVGTLLRVVFAALVAFSLLLPFIDIGWIAGLLGRDPDLTGRVPIWNGAIRFIVQRPLLGYGFGGFFDPIPNSPVWEFWAMSRDSQAAHFHSSAVDLMIALGVIGLAAYVHTLWSSMTLVYNRSIGRTERIVLAGSLIFFLIGASVDTTFMTYNSYATMFLFYCVFAAGTQYPTEPETSAR
ncbi:MAG: O-antigen ligase family protein [Hyphomicrobiaceae bacterium]